MTRDDIEVALTGAHIVFLRLGCEFCNPESPLISILLAGTHDSALTSTEQMIEEGPPSVNAARAARVRLYGWSGAKSPSEVLDDSVKNLVLLESKVGRGLTGLAED